MSQEKMNIQFRIKAVDKFSRVMHNLNRQIDRTKAKLDSLDTWQTFRVHYDDDDVRSSVSGTVSYVNEELSRVNRMNIRAGLGDAYKDIETLSKKMQELRDKSFEVTVDTTRARLKLNYLIRKIDEMDSSFKVDADTKQAREKLNYVIRRIESINDKKVKINADSAGARANIAAFKEWAEQKIVIPVDVDTKAAAAKLNRMRKRLQGDLFTMKVGADTSEINRALQRMEGVLGTNSSDVDLRTGGAIAKAEAVGAALDHATRDREVKVDVDKSLKSSVGEIGQALTKFKNDYRKTIDRIADFSRDVSEVVRHSFGSFALTIAPGLSAIGAQGVAALAGIGNMLGVTSGAALGLGTAFGAAGAGAVAVGALAGSALGDVFEVSEDIKRLQERLALTNDAKKQAKILEEIEARTALLSKEQQSALKSLSSLQGAWGDMAGAFEPRILTMFATGLGMIEQSLNRLQPTFEGSVTAAESLMRSLNANLDSGDVVKFFDFLNRMAGPSMQQLGEGAGHLAVAFMNLMTAFEPLATVMAEGFNKSMKSFRDWTAALDGSTSMQSFIDYVTTNWPKVQNIIGSVVKGIVDVFKAFAPQSEQWMTSLEDLADRFQEWAKTLGDNERFQAFIDFIEETGPKVASFIGALVDAFISVGEAMRPLASLALTVGTAFLELFAWLMQSPFGTIAVAIVSVISGFSFLWPLIKLVTGGWKLLVAIATPLVTGFKSIGTWLGKLWGAFKNSATFARLFFAAIRLGSGPIGWLISAIIFLASVVLANWDSIVKWTGEAWKAVTKWIVVKFGEAKQFVTETLQTIATWMVTKWNEMKSTVANKVAEIGTAVNKGFTKVKQWIADKLAEAATALSNAWSDMVSWTAQKAAEIVTTVRNKFEELKNAISEKLKLAESIVSTTVDTIKGLFDIDLSAAGREIIASVARGISGAVGLVTDAIGSVTSKLRGFLPFSPAKWGPLSDIHRLNFGGPISDSIHRAQPTVMKAMNRMLAVPAINAGDVYATARRNAYNPAGAGAQYRKPHDSKSKQVIEVPVYLNGREIAKAAKPELDRIEDREDERDRRFAKGGRQ